jgi:hypothetical protein
VVRLCDPLVVGCAGPPVCTVHRNQMGNAICNGVLVLGLVFGLLVWFRAVCPLNGEMRASTYNMWRLHCVAGVVTCVSISK